MTRFHHLLLAILLLFSTSQISCSNKPVSASFYQNHISSHESANWKSETITITHLTGHTVGSNGCIGGSSLKDVPLLVKYMEDSTGHLGPVECHAVVISIDSLEHGIMWMPLFKEFTFKSTVPVKIERIFFRPSGDSTKVVWYRVNGEVKVTGKVNIKGLCSKREARRLMVKAVMDDVYTSVRKEMDDLQ